MAWFTEHLNLALPAPRGYADKQRKLEQVVAFLEVIQAEVRRYSRRHPLTFVDCGAGNCHLSLAAALYFTNAEPRPVEIHCVDNNVALMAKHRDVADALGLGNMHFHACDIGQLTLPAPVDVVMALHACDVATDKAMHLGVQTHARHILTVACCQQSLVKSIRSNAASTTAITRHHLFKERLAYMAGDAMRALLLEMQGYEVDIIELVSSRATDKNTLVRARRRNRPPNPAHAEALASLMASFRTVPALADYLGHQPTGRQRSFARARRCTPACSCERHDVGHVSAS
ncbi:methyltransferase [Actinopolymorpha rutila]|uniref:Methyltransferase domain-containing protein n=1 Tax=Actinopolymorpha rutila TaxID=446787 RepID=A0A852ZUC8_9ACTN|nr:methyltransferase [Actinopolymorpha rutila]NYH92939.1 hypothetical protein [Actinopolymorpha rutila]